jgi:hypothetical protein
MTYSRKIDCPRGVDSPIGVKSLSNVSHRLPYTCPSIFRLGPEAHPALGIGVLPVPDWADQLCFFNADSRQLTRRSADLDSTRCDLQHGTGHASAPSPDHKNKITHMSLSTEMIEIAKVSRISRSSVLVARC